jgi:histone acetyltransferase (RNA polymerase elongator complex component)
MGRPISVPSPTVRPLIVPLFIPHLGCPHRCVFCNQHAVTATAAHIPSPEQIHHDINRFLAYAKNTRPTTQVSFYGGNFLGLDKSVILTLLEAVTPFIASKAVNSIRFSTRPDTIDRRSLYLLNGFPVSTVELGVQSMSDRVLTMAGRGHRALDTETAVGRLKQRGYQVGLQMMVGLPGDSAEGAIATARRIAALSPDFVRIYPTVVLRGSALEKRYRHGQYRPMALASCVRLVKRLLLFFNARNIPVIRLGLQASDELTRAGGIIAGPFHPAFGHLVHAEIARDAIAATLAEMASRPDPLTIITHPAAISRVQGLNKNNIKGLSAAFGLAAISLIQDPHLPKNQLIVAGRRITLP